MSLKVLSKKLESSRWLGRSSGWGALLVTSALLVMSTGCKTSPFTGRKSFRFLPAGELNALGASEYASFLAEHQLSKDERLVEQVRGLGERIAVAAEVALEGEGDPELLAGYDWEFNVIESDEANAFCMPGGKVVVFTGLLPITQDGKSLAVVMGHEIAHAIAEHGNERLSQMLAAQLGGVALNVAMRDRPSELRQLFTLAYGVGTTVGVLLPFSRAQESEADEIGLYLSTLAGYDPRAAEPLWQRMAAQSPAVPEFLSTHPGPEHRARHLRELVPQALEYRSRYGAEFERRLRALPERSAGRPRAFLAPGIGGWASYRARATFGGWPHYGFSDQERDTTQALIPPTPMDSLPTIERGSSTARL